MILNDHRTIFTTLKECMQLSGDKIAIVTFDLPIWLKAVDIIKQENLPVIPRLAGFICSNHTSGPCVISWKILDYRVDPAYLSRKYNCQPVVEDVSILSEW